MGDVWNHFHHASDAHPGLKDCEITAGLWVHVAQYRKAVLGGVDCLWQVLLGETAKADRAAALARAIKKVEADAAAAAKAKAEAEVSGRELGVLEAQDHIMCHVHSHPPSHNIGKILGGAIT